MAVEFRCEKCGKLLSVEAEPGAKVRCQYCNGKVAVPAALASLPRPQVPTEAPPPPATPEAQVEEAHQQDALMGVMAALMPWILSLFLHAGILLILAFLTILSYSTKVAEGITVPDANLTKRPGSKLNPARRQSKLRTKSMARTAHNWAKRSDTLSTDRGRTKNPVSLHGLEGESGVGDAGDFGMRSGAGGAPRSRFMGMGGNAYHIVLIVDCSGSMMGPFDLVKREINKTITQLLPTQTFHVIFFVWKLDSKRNESPRRRLVNATVRNKREALEFIKGVRPYNPDDVPDHGGLGVGRNTNPLAALQRAFEVLAHPPNDKPGKIIYLLTDGVFSDNEEVRRKVRQWNKKGDVRVNTIFYGDPEDEDGIKDIKQLAAENGGKFKFEERRR